MSKLDPQLEFLTDDGFAQLEALDIPSELARYGVRSKKRRRGAASTPAAAEVDVLVQYTGDPEALEAAGLTVRAVAGDVVSGSIGLDRLAELAELAQVERVEGARAMYGELDLATADTHVDDVQTGPPGYRGSGVIVGIVDSGIDYTHNSFRRADGRTRILRIWDQGLTAGAGEAAPAPFGYGIEYSAAQIDAALVAADPFAVVRHRDNDPNRHGTHVTGIAAGDGSDPGQGQPAGTFAGVATEADIIVAGNGFSDAEGLGNSARTLDAVTYIFQQATALGRPCVINMSLGDNLGPHDGTALLERGIDNLLGGQGRVLVKSAGNAAADRIHAQGTIATGATVDVRFTQPAGDTTTNQMDLWYDGADTFQVTVIDPAGNSVGPVAVGATTQVTLAGGNVVRVSHRNNDPQNGDKRAFITFTPGSAGTMRTGTWILRLTSVTSASGGSFDAWIQRGQVIPQFLAPHENPERTISTPGTANEVITAASYITRGAGVGSRSTFSSRGPTRDGRLAPTIAAPGEWIVSARGHAAAGQDPYVQLAGTSMAAPHVAGAVALILQKTPTLTTAEVAQILRDNARTDTFTGPTPNTAWGAGKLDLTGAFRVVPPMTIKSVLEPDCRRSVVNVACIVSVVKATCPSTLSACFSVPTNTCPPSVPRLSCISTLTRCPSQVTLCPSQALPCNSLPQCIEPTVVQSVIDCGPKTVLTTLVNPPTDPFRTTVLGPGGVGGLGGLGGNVRGGFQGAAAFQRGGQDADTGAQRTAFGNERPPQQPQTIPGYDCPQTVPGYDCPPWPQTIPGYDCPPWPQTIPGYDCPPWQPKTVPGVDCPDPQPQTIPGWDCPQPFPQTIPTMDCPTVASVPGHDCPQWTIPQVDCPRPGFPGGWQDPTAWARMAGGAPAQPAPREQGAGDRTTGGPRTVLPTCGFGTSVPANCTWWSVPWVNCGIVPPTILPEKCPSQLPQDCLSQLVRPCPPPPSIPITACRTIPQWNCWAPTSLGCPVPTSLGCPSQVGCPSQICATTNITTVIGPQFGVSPEGYSSPTPGTQPGPGQNERGFYDYDESWWD